MTFLIEFSFLAFFNRYIHVCTLTYYIIYLCLIHLCYKLSVILISHVIPLLIVASGYVIKGGALTILISRNQTRDVKSPAKYHEWGQNRMASAFIMQK